MIDRDSESKNVAHSHFFTEKPAVNGGLFCLPQKTFGVRWQLRVLPLASGVRLVDLARARSGWYCSRGLPSPNEAAPRREAGEFCTRTGKESEKQGIREALLPDGEEAMRGMMTIRWLLLCGLAALEVSAAGCAAFRPRDGLLGRMGLTSPIRGKNARPVESPLDLQVSDIVIQEQPGEVSDGSKFIPDAVRLTELLQRAAEEPRRAQWQAELATYWLQAGQLQEADSYAVRAIGLDQHHAGAWLVRGAVASERSDWSTALGCYQQAINSRGDDGETLSRIADCYQQMGEPRRALSACERAAELSPGGKPDHRLLVQQGRLLAELGQSRRAISLLEAAVAQPEATASSWLALSEAQALAGESSAARATLARAQELFPGSPQWEQWQQARVPGESPLAVWK